MRAVNLALLIGIEASLEVDMVKKSVAAFVILLFYVYSVAQQPGSASKKALADAAWTRAGCGSDDARFDVKVDKTQHPLPQPEAGKAMVYVFEDDLTRGGLPTTRVGFDGKWTGGNVPDSYMFFSVPLGVHRLCSNWQGNSRIGAAVDFTAEAGKTYYFHVTITSFGSDEFALKPVENAEGQFLIATHHLSTSKLKDEATESGSTMSGAADALQY